MNAQQETQTKPHVDTTLVKAEERKEGSVDLRVYMLRTIHVA